MIKLKKKSMINPLNGDHIPVCLFFCFCFFLWLSPRNRRKPTGSQVEQTRNKALVLLQDNFTLLHSVAEEIITLSNGHKLLGGQHEVEKTSPWI